MWRGRSQRRIAYPPSPPGFITYVVADIHGRSDLLAETHRLIDHDALSTAGSSNVVEVYLGDYIDRGPSSAAVIESLLHRAQYRWCVFLRGNHEEVMDAFLRGTLPLSTWLSFGGAPTLLSYGCSGSDLIEQHEIQLVERLNALVPAGHRVFLNTLCNSFEIGPYFFAHAGVRPGRPLDQQEKSDLLWIREDFTRHVGDFGRIVIHGHTPVAAPDFQANRINLDTGAFSTGRLTCLRIGPAGVDIVGP